MLLKDKEYIQNHISMRLIPDHFEGARILVVGSEGMIGHQLCNYLEWAVDNKHINPKEIIAIDNYSAYDLKSKRTNGKFSFRHGNICDPNLPILNAPEIDYIICLASLATPSIYMQYPVETMDVGYIGTKNVIELGRRTNAKSILFCSSSEVYQTPPNFEIPTREEYVGNISAYSDRSCYDVSKLVLETLCNIYYKKYASPVKIIRPFNFYGYHSFRDTRAVANFMRAAIAGKDITVYNRNVTRTYCYLPDGIIGLFCALIFGNSARPYNIGRPAPEITSYELGEAVIKASNSKSKINIVPYPDTYPKDEPMRRCPDISRAIDEIGFDPEIELDDGLKTYYTWLVDNG